MSIAVENRPTCSVDLALCVVLLEGLPRVAPVFDHLQLDEARDKAPGAHGEHERQEQEPPGRIPRAGMTPSFCLGLIYLLPSTSRRAQDAAGRVS